MNTKEWINQLAHYGIGLFISYFTTCLLWLISHLAGLKPVMWLLCIAGMLGAFICGVTVEICQWMYNDNHEWKLFDRIRDIFSYIVGSGNVWFLLLV